MPRRSMIRARGFLSGGANNGSAWYAERTTPAALPPEVVVPDGGLDPFGVTVRALEGQVVVVEATTATNLLWRFYRLRVQ